MGLWTRSLRSSRQEEGAGRSNRMTLEGVADPLEWSSLYAGQRVAEFAQLAGSDQEVEEVLLMPLGLSFTILVPGTLRDSLVSPKTFKT